MLAIIEPLICTVASCQDATSDVSECECSCEGVDHGLHLRSARRAARDTISARSARTGDVFLGAANNDDEGAF